MKVVRSAIKLLISQGMDLQIVPQNLVELWVVATRPVEQNGLGMAPAAVAVELTRINMFELLPETPAIYTAWERLVVQYQMYGKTAHDARLVAAMHVPGLTALLTFDKAGFSRYAGIKVVDPATLVSSYWT